MKEMQWTDDLSVGVGLVDEQHKMLIQHLNELTRSIESRQGPAKIVETLDFLARYTDFHFSTEEKHMAANDYQGLEQHQAKHAEFKTTLADLEQDFREEGATSELADSIDTLLVNWLVGHIKSVDVEFGTFLKTKGITIEE
jgi:hemerythrin